MLHFLKRDSKIEYYKSYFATNSNKVANIWKGIHSLIKLSHSSRKEISLLNDNGKTITDPLKISTYFNQTFVPIGRNIDNKISKGKFHYSHYLSNVRINKSFFLTHATPKEVYNILSLDLNKSVGPNSLPIFILKICNEFFSHYLSKIINTAFTTGIFPNLCKLAKVYPSLKKTTH